MTRPPKSKAMERLQNLLNEIPELRDFLADSPEFKKWHRRARITISNVFEKDDSHLKEFLAVSFLPPTSAPEIDSYLTDAEQLRQRARYEIERKQSFVKGLEVATALLESMFEEIEEYWEHESDGIIVTVSQKENGIDASRVFVVHGRDHGTRDSVARFLEKKDLYPVILSEQPDEGLTIIEKFEKHANSVGFAVVLLTPDDVGGIKEDNGNLRQRARQNVILELGFFLGRLGRDRVCAVIKGDVESPSDYHGVLYIPLDAYEGWQKQLARNLKAAGFKIEAE